MDSTESQPRKTVPAQPTREASKKPQTDVATKSAKRAWPVAIDLEEFYSNVPCTD